MSDKISIIVPVYNSAQSLEHTVRAILDGSYKNIELILIDDGSTDGSADIIKELAVRDERIVVGTKENGGPSSARNAGLKLATGEYIAFCDADDIPSADMYARLYSRLCESGADAVLCDIYSERNGTPLGFPWVGDVCLRESQVVELIAAMIGNENDGCESAPVWGSVCRGLYRADVIKDNGILFPTDIHFAEDLVFSLRYLKRTRCAAIINEALYTYRDTQGSIMNSYFSYKPNMPTERLTLVDYLLKEIEGLDEYELLRQRLQVTERCYYHECVGNACRNPDGREARRELRDLLNDARVRDAFKNIRSATPRKGVIYSLIRLRAVRILYFYYRSRFKKTNTKK